MKVYWGNGGIAPRVLTSALGGGGQLHAPAALLPREGHPGTHWIGCWLDPRFGYEYYIYIYIF